jgi:VIT1/CCC1 family predicted Fe2+/Mn2+ transporter
MEQKPLNLNELVHTQTLNLSLTPTEDPAVRDARLRREEASAAHERRKELALYLTTALIIVAAFGICAFVVLSKNFSGELDKWATALLTSIVTGLVGYVTGKASK